MAFLLAGDSIAVGLQLYGLRPNSSAVRVGRRTAQGAAIIAKRPEKRVVVSLGTNDDPGDTKMFRASIKRVLNGRSCVIWLTLPRHKAFNDILRQEDRRYKRLHRVNAAVPTSDGIHPTVAGYKAINTKVRKKLKTC